MLWHLEIRTAPNHPDSTGRRLAQEAVESGLPGPWRATAGRGFLVEGNLSATDLEEAARRVLVDPVVEAFHVRPCPSVEDDAGTVVHVTPKPGVTDPEGESALGLLRDLGYAVDGARSIRTYRIEGPADQLPRLIQRVLANDAVEQVFRGSLRIDRLGEGQAYDFELITVPIRSMDDAALMKTSKDGQLSLSLAEMRTIQGHFAELGRDPTDAELETLAQTWSEHCSHKTLKGRIEFEGRTIQNLLKETIFAATQKLSLDWLVSVFSDNAGVVRFDDEYDVCFKVETHNHPSAIDPYGGANTGIGGVIRDALGTGLGAKPICNTDVFCVAAPDLPPDQVPAGVLHPKRVLKGIVAGVRDYGNRMGIPTVNGALAVDPGYLANPLVFCGTVGVLPRGKAFKSVEAGDRIVAIGGRTGRDGIHGATFSSVELTSQSESISGGSVQIGNAITEKMVLDVIVQARDRALFRSVTDCGAGGFSSAVGEMGAELGAVVDLENAPLKYQGLSYTEIWISEAQERMVLAVPPESWPELRDLCALEGVEATDLGEFVATGRLTLRYHDKVVGDLSMDFLHEGRPLVVRSASFTPPPERPIELPESQDFTADLLAILGHWDVCSKEWIVRQYDHEVQARTVVKPLVGVREDGPGDASVILPVAGSNRGLVISCGINPRYGKIDPYAMAACVIDEAIRNCVAVGADPRRIALLDNFCWGNTERPETLGSLVLAAQACHDLAMAYKTPFISGKDSLYNEYTHDGKSLAIPPTLLISAIGQTPDASRCVTMDFKRAGNLVVVVGSTRREFGGSLWSEVRGVEGGAAPAVDPALGSALFQALFTAIQRGLVRSCHDLSEGGLAVALAEMAFAGGVGAEISLRDVPCDDDAAVDAALLFSESPSRFLLEIEPDCYGALADLFGGLPLGRLGETRDGTDGEPTRLTITGLDGSPVVDSTLSALEEAWRRPLRW
ncbi:MAG: phosphoribosylformylglycinamidine synthase subunit PurL [Paludisphaera borealis]|uniref:phosphoribosylformylglycinamidine synthase subunit PurL n=1 Tax=Paludisphaera borealis TaxID=1387353 RepID=UPI0028517507|nr:phosphoribosylformylglycinamidine synthase subunit PurL [Paludisphaera borealis]MDR3622428.1 phosphoribosylformylglycinamidine synthase subunit PurL [Paludisphaera borealis]